MKNCIWKLSNLCDSKDPKCKCKDYRTAGSKTGQYMKKKYRDRFKKVITATDYSNGTDYTVQTKAVIQDGKIGVLETKVIKEIITDKNIPGYEGYYTISPAGEVKSLDRIIVNSLGRKQHVKACTLKWSYDEKTRAKVNLNKNGKSKTFKIKRLLDLCYGGKS